MTNRQRLRDLFNEGYELTYEQMSMRLGIEDRQLRRLVRDLRNEGVPVEERREGRNKVFFIPEAHQERRAQGILLEEEELLALTVAAQAARTAFAPTPLGPPLERAFGRLLEDAEVFSFDPVDEPSNWHFDVTAVSALEADVFSTVAAAVRKRQQLRIDYYSASSDTFTEGRLVDPYVISVRGTSWLLTAYCHLRRGFRDFSLAAIQRAVPLDAYFERGAFDPEQHFRDRFSAVGGADDYVVRLEVTADKAPYFRRKRYHPTQQIEAEHDDGAVVVSFEVRGLEEIAAFVRSWGPGVCVTEPPELRSRLAADARCMAASYGDGV